MRNWRETLKALTSSPRGHLPADGRTLGLGLATAMEKQRRNSAREVEDYLRTTPSERVKASA
jgi:hypothetical protein